MNGTMRACSHALLCPASIIPHGLNWENMIALDWIAWGSFLIPSGLATYPLRLILILVIFRQISGGMKKLKYPHLFAAYG
jgi:hypothetical protein